MYSNVQRSAAYKTQLMEWIRQTYGLSPQSLEPAKRGFYGETWQLKADGGRYFLKLDYSIHQSIYERSFPALERLHEHGLDFVSRIVKTADGCLCARYDGAVLGLFEWIDGENMETDETKIPEYQMLAQVYAVPCDGLDLPRERFGSDSATVFFNRWATLAENAHNASTARALAVLEANRGTMQHRAARLVQFADRCAGDQSHMYLTHGDAGGNVLVQGDNYFIVDWDDPRIAPPERDAWFMCPEDWARASFESALSDHGIPYRLRPERLGYYCYNTYFLYLNEHLDCLGETGAVEGLEAYFGSWIEWQLQYAEQRL